MFSVYICDSCNFLYYYIIYSHDNSYLSGSLWNTLTNNKYDIQRNNYMRIL